MDEDDATALFGELERRLAQRLEGAPDDIMPFRWCEKHEKPATAGTSRATPSVEACARCAVPKASLTYISPRLARALAYSRSFASSSGWKRRFSISSTSPS